MKYKRDTEMDDVSVVYVDVAEMQDVVNEFCTKRDIADVDRGELIEVLALFLDVQDLIRAKRIIVKKLDRDMQYAIIVQKNNNWNFDLEVEL